MELNDCWVWRHHVKDKSKNYEQNTQEICRFNTIQQMWKYYNNIPLPTTFFKFDKNIKKINGKNVHAWSIFRKGIEPAWEDENNINGGEVNLRTFEYKDQIDDLWEHTMVTVLGEDFEYSENITGIRVVDSSNHFKFMYRIEIWYDDASVEEKIKKDIHSVFNFPEGQNITYKNHK